MKRTREAPVHLDDDDDDDEDFFAEPIEEDEEGRVDSLQSRLRRARPTFALGPGESVFDIEGKNDLLSRPQWTREDGTLGTKVGGKDVRVANGEEEQGLAYRKEEFDRRDIVNRDPRITFLRLLAGCTYQDVESLFDHSDLENQKRYNEELREWNKMERERLMVGSDQKKIQLDIVESRLSNMRQQREVLEWSARFVTRFADEMNFLLSPIITKESDSAASLPLCYLFTDQYKLARDLRNKLKDVVDKKEDDVALGELRSRFLKHFVVDVKDRFKHELADGFLAFARTLLGDHATLPKTQFQGFALSVYKYLYTRDEYAPGSLLVAEGRLSKYDLEGGIIMRDGYRKVSMHAIVRDTTRDLLFLYLRNQAMQLYFVEFSEFKRHHLDDDAPVAKKTSVGTDDKGKSREKSDAAAAFRVAEDDLDFIRKYKALEESLERKRSDLSKVKKNAAKTDRLNAEIAKIIEQLGKLTSTRAARYENILEAMNTPIANETFLQLLAGSSSAMKRDRLLAIIGLATKEKPNLNMKTWLEASPPKQSPFNDKSAARDNERRQYINLLQATAAVIHEVVLYDKDNAIVDSGSFWKEGLTRHARKYISAALLFSNLVGVVTSVVDEQQTMVIKHKKPGAPITKMALTFNGLDVVNFENSFNRLIGMEVVRMDIVFGPQDAAGAVAFLQLLIGLRRRLSGTNDNDGNVVATTLLENEALKAFYINRAFQPSNNMDIYNLLYLDTGKTVLWDVTSKQITELKFVGERASILENVVNTFIDPLLSGSMAALAFFVRHEETIALFQPAALDIPLAAHLHFQLDDGKDPSAAQIGKTTEFLKALDMVMENLKLSKDNEDSETFIRAWRGDPAARSLVIGRHGCLLLALFIIAWGAFIYPREKADADSEIDRAVQVIRDAQAELYRLAMGGTLSVKDQRDKVKDLYTPSSQWQMRVENTGRVELTPPVVLALDAGLTLVRENIPQLSNATLDALMLAKADSGLPGAFARLVGALMNHAQLTWPQTYNKDLQYRLDPRLRQACLNNLRNYRIIVLPDGQYDARRVVHGEWPGSGNAPADPSSSLVSIVFI